MVRLALAGHELVSRPNEGLRVREIRNIIIAHLDFSHRDCVFMQVHSYALHLSLQNEQIVKIKHFLDKVCYNLA